MGVAKKDKEDLQRIAKRLSHKQSGERKCGLKVIGRKRKALPEAHEGVRKKKATHRQRNSSTGHSLPRRPKALRGGDKGARKQFSNGRGRHLHKRVPRKKIRKSQDLRGCVPQEDEARKGEVWGIVQRKKLGNEDQTGGKV